MLELLRVNVESKMYSNAHSLLYIFLILQYFKIYRKVRQDRDLPHSTNHVFPCEPCPKDLFKESLYMNYI